MMMPRAKSTIQRSAATLCVLLVCLPAGFAQNPLGPPQDSAGIQSSAPRLSPDQLDNLVAPIALYPDPLLGQVMAASTYPLEIVEAQQWIQQNGNLQGAQLMDAARQQNWDPSVAALVAFPDVLHLLGNDVRWTTDLGNAFLSQQTGVLAAVQRMRARAQANGKLQSTPQQMVTTGTQDGQSAIEIQPASPQVMYVPVYQPEYVWGPPAFGAYPANWYPQGFGYGLGFDPGIFLNALFQGFTGWGGWGWILNWFGHGLLGGGGLFGHSGGGAFGSGLLVNAGFFNHYGFRGGLASPVGGGLGAWQHNASHRMGVQYPTQALASRFNRASAASFNGGRTVGAYANQRAGNQGVANQSGWRSFNGGSSRPVTNSFAGSYRQASPGYQAPAQNFRGFYSAPGRGSTPSYSGSTASRVQNYSSPRSYSASGPRQSYSASAPRQSYSAPREAKSAPRPSSSAGRSFSAPRSSGGQAHVSSGHSGGGGGHSHGGGGHSGGKHHK
jgi:hypothetical protein